MTTHPQTGELSSKSGNMSLALGADPSLTADNKAVQQQGPVRGDDTAHPKHTSAATGTDGSDGSV